MSNKPNPAPLRRGFSFARFRFALIFNIQAVKTAFLFAMCIHCQRHKTPHRATQSKTANAAPTEPQPKPHNQQHRQPLRSFTRSDRQRAHKNAAGAQEHRRKPERLHRRSESKTHKASNRRIRAAYAFGPSSSKPKPPNIIIIFEVIFGYFLPQ